MRDGETKRLMMCVCERERERVIWLEISQNVYY